MPLAGTPAMAGASSSFGPVEKVVFLLMRPPGGDVAGLSKTLTGPAADDFRARGATRIQVNVVDPDLGKPFAAAPDPDQPSLDAAVSMWVDTAEGSSVAAGLPDPGDGGRWHGYLVSEAEPLRNTAHPPGPDGRVPGFAQLVPLTKPDRLSWAEWRRVWQGAHTSVAINTQSSFRYVQNVVLRALTPGAPRFGAVVEECFPTEAAHDLAVFFDAVGDEAKMARHMTAMSESCDRFMDGLSAIAWTAEWVIPEAGAARP